jgi:hypothetical protein
MVLLRRFPRHWAAKRNAPIEQQRWIVATLFPNGHQSGTFARAPLAAVEDCLVRWGNEEKVNRGTTARRHRMTLERAWDLVAAREFNPTRAFLIDVSGGWTAFFDNHSREFCPAAELYVLCRNLRCETCFFSHDDRADPEHHGSAHFCFHRHTGGEPEVAERQVLLFREGGWRFQQSGDPLPFEQADAYALRSKRDRLTSDMLRAYSEALGLRFWEAGAYGTDVSELRWGMKPARTAGEAMMIVKRIFGR